MYALGLFNQTLRCWHTYQLWEHVSETSLAYKDFYLFSTELALESTIAGCQPPSLD